MIKQQLKQKLLQKLSPQQIQLMKLIQVSTAALENRIKDELEQNPALETGAESNEERDEYDFSDDQETREYDSEKNETEPEMLDMSEYMSNEDEINSGNYSNYGNDDDDSRELPIKIQKSFHEHLSDQIGMLELSETDKLIASHVIGSIDDDGYLRRETESLVDDLAFKHNTIVSEMEVEQVIKRVQSLDPLGVGARDLRESLLIQLKHIQNISPAHSLAYKVLETCFSELGKRHYAKICIKLDCSNEELKAAQDIIVKLTPKPGYGFVTESSLNTQYVMPDFFVFVENGKLKLTLNDKNAPELHVSQTYVDMMKSYTRQKTKTKREALTFIKHKLDSAKWFIDAIKQRQQTLLLTMNTIMEMQEKFFYTGDPTSLKPMILKDVAERIEMDISTISRVTKSKYVQTEYGIFSLKFFFSEGIVNEDGDEVSTNMVKKKLQDLVVAEDKTAPLGDLDLVKLINEAGYNIARRTVSKYREQLDIPVARLRKEI